MWAPSRATPWYLTRAIWPDSMGQVPMRKRTGSPALTLDGSRGASGVRCQRFIRTLGMQFAFPRSGRRERLPESKYTRVEAMDQSDIQHEGTLAALRDVVQKRQVCFDSFRERVGFQHAGSRSIGYELILSGIHSSGSPPPPPGRGSCAG